MLRMQATLVGGRVFVFGGEDASRRPLGELHVLDPAACSWQPVTTTGTPPSPRRRALFALPSVAVTRLFLCMSSDAAGLPYPVAHLAQLILTPSVAGAARTRRWPSATGSCWCLPAAAWRPASRTCMRWTRTP